jgi:urease accessory protein
MITTTEVRPAATAGSVGPACVAAGPAALDAVSLMRLLQLASPALPVGAYAWSEGMEQAVEAGDVHDLACAKAWILGLLAHGPARLDVPMLGRMRDAFVDGDDARARRLSIRLLASRETLELRATDRALGCALARVLADLGVENAQPWVRGDDSSFAALFALASQRFNIPAHSAACALLWTWCENMVAAAIKLVPLGQRAGQGLLFEAGTAIPGLATAGLALDDEDIAGGAPGLALASARHELQRTRLFRS